MSTRRTRIYPCSPPLLCTTEAGVVNYRRSDSGQLHREHGPAVMVLADDGSVAEQEWWLNGVQVTEAEFNAWRPAR